MKHKIILHSLGHAVGAFLYITAVAWVMSNGEKIFSGEPKNLWVPVFMLLLFVLSAAITGALVLGKPIMLYLSGTKSEAIRFLTYTIAWLFIILIIVFALQPWK